MNPVSLSWARKANKDFQTAMREMAIPAHANYEAVCFHSHQCVLRYLRARIALADADFPGTTHIVVLLEMVLELEPEWDDLRNSLRVLRNAAMDLEDPDFEPTKEIAQQAFDACHAVRKCVRARLENMTLESE